MKQKYCTKCKQIKNINVFSNDISRVDGKFPWCKECKYISDKEYREKNKDRLTLKKKQWYLDNINRKKEQDKIRYLINKEKIKERVKQYRINNKRKIRKQKRIYESKRYNYDINYKIKNILKSRIRLALKSQHTVKKKTSIKLLGADITFVRKWIESQFVKGMTWNNYGEWHIDHVYPISKFDLTQPYEQKICFHWFNLQPLWKADNFKKSNKLYI